VSQLETLKKFNDMFAQAMPDKSGALVRRAIEGKSALSRAEMQMLPESTAAMRWAEMRLAQFGFLDPSQVNGIWGDSTTKAFELCLQAYGLKFSGKFDSNAVFALVKGEKRFQNKPERAPGTILSIQLEAIKEVASKQGKWERNKLNIVGLRGFVDGKGAVPNTPDIYNDVIAVVHEAHGILRHWRASCDPGRYYTQIAPLNARGAAHLAKGKWLYKLGRHGQSQYPALVQAAPVKVFRTFGPNPTAQDFSESGFFGINIHAGTYSESVYNASAGCQVIRSMSTAGSDWKSFYGLVAQFAPQKVFDYFLCDGDEM
jgi:hypothetical protein